MKKLLPILLLILCCLLSACDNLDTDQQPVQAAQITSETVTGPPSISATFINDLLCKYDSPVCGDGETLYANGLRYGIDPVWPLAIFWNESNFGRTGEARSSLSIGNLRCLDRAHYGDLGTWCQDGYAWFPSWQAGIIACYRLLAGPLYVQGGLTTIERIIRRWAPSADGNNPTHYIEVVQAAVSLWRAGKVQVPAW